MNTIAKNIILLTELNILMIILSEKILKKSEIRAKWDKKFDVAKEAKEQFLKLKIAQ